MRHFQRGIPVGICGRKGLDCNEALAVKAPGRKPVKTIVAPAIRNQRVTARKLRICLSKWVILHPFPDNLFEFRKDREVSL